MATIKAFLATVRDRAAALARRMDILQRLQDLEDFVEWEKDTMAQIDDLREANLRLMNATNALLMRLSVEQSEKAALKAQIESTPTSEDVQAVIDSANATASVAEQALAAPVA